MLTDEEWVAIFSSKMKEFKKRSGMTYEQLGEICGMQKQTLCAYCNGKKMPNVISIVRIARGLGIPVSWLVDFEYNGKKNERS